MATADTLFRKSCDFVAGATRLEDIPAFHLPEVAFVGRSNVGKSSLLNAITRRKSLARTSKTPGCTRQINFFNLADMLMLVDLPGYGYAKVGRKEVEGWNDLIIAYLQGRPNLRQVCLLIDARHGLKSSDEAIMDILDEAAVSYQIVLTKMDKQTRSGLDTIIARLEALGKKHPALHPDVLESSARDKTNIDALRKRLASFT